MYDQDHHQMSYNGIPPNFFPSPNFVFHSTPHDHQEADMSSFHPSFTGEDIGEENLSDDVEGSAAVAGERKIMKRLNVEQVRTLERSFEMMGNKLEPERKTQLAMALGLQPRQIAIWFQNKRARWKTKQLEKDFDALKCHFDAIRAENQALQTHNKRLQAEISALKGIENIEPINFNKETEGSCSNRSENCSSDLNLDISPPTDHHGPHEQNNFFQPSYRQIISGTPQHLLHSPGKPAPQGLQCEKVEHASSNGAAQDESLCNLFPAMDEQSALIWAWSEQQNLH